MADDIDRAQRINEQFQTDALRNHGLMGTSLRNHGLMGTSLRSFAHPTVCIDCEEPIPQARRKAVPGCTRCVECQTMHENWRPC